MMNSETFLSDPRFLDAVIVLQDILQGEALLPGADAFAENISTFSTATSHAPALVVLPESTSDIVETVRFARKLGLPIAVQGTGHGIIRPCESGVLINTRRMQGVHIDSERRTARVEAGVKWSAMIPKAQEFGLAPLCGSSSDVGVIGYTLGGGHGWLARRYGRAAERIVSADLVTASGEAIEVSAESYPELLEALRGGSGNFGIVTALEFELVPVPHVYGGATFYPLAHAREVFAAFRKWTSALPESITASVTILQLPPLPVLPPPLRGAACVAIRACACDEFDTAEATIAPMRSIATALMDTFRMMPFSEIDTISMDPVDPAPIMSRTLMLDSLRDNVVTAMLNDLGPASSLPVLVAEFRYIGDSTAYSSWADCPDAPFAMFAVGFTDSPEALAKVDALMDRMATALAPVTSSRVLLNFLADSDMGDQRTRAAFDEATFVRLQRIKAMYDPENRFRFNNNILPARIVVNAESPAGVRGVLANLEAS